MNLNEPLQSNVQSAIIWKPFLNPLEIDLAAKHNLFYAKNLVNLKAQMEEIEIQAICIGRIEDSNIRIAFNRNTHLKRQLQRLTEMCDLCHAALDS